MTVELLELARSLTVIDAEIRALREQRDHIIAALAEAMPTKIVELPGFGVLERKAGNKRTRWDHESLLRVVLARSRDERLCDPSTGEYEDSGEAAVRVLAECARMEWRVTPLRARGLQVDEFCEVEKAPPTVILRLANEAKGDAA